jgi:hypothetical protein
MLEGSVENNLFFLHVTGLPSRKDISLCHGSRLATVFSNITLNTHFNLSNSVCFLFQLFPFICESAVVQLFTSVGSQNPHLSGLPRILATSSFSALLLKQFGSALESGMTEALCRLIAVCLKHLQLHSCFANETF